MAGPNRQIEKWTRVNGLGAGAGRGSGWGDRVADHLAEQCTELHFTAAHPRQVRIQVVNTICIERFKDYPQLGRFTLRDEGRTVAIGKARRPGLRALPLPC